MLDHIAIKHFTIIDTLALDIHDQMTVITGETGSGKSIIIDAIAFALGERANAHTLYPEADRAEVSLTFTRIGPANDWLKEHNMDANDTCIIRRTLSRDGHSRYTINDTPCTAKLLRELSTLLISIHGQHAHQALLKSSEQRALVDQYAGNDAFLKETHRLHEAWKKTLSEKEALQKHSEKGSQALNFIQFQLNELDDLALQPDEIDQLHTEHKQLHHAQALQSNTHDCLSLLSFNDDSIEQRLATALHRLESAAAITPLLSSALELLNTTAITLNEAIDELRHVNFTSDTDRLQAIETRLNLIEKISRKHRVKPEQLIDIHQKLQAEKELLEKSDEHIKHLDDQLKKIEDEYQKIARTLSLSRQKTAALLGERITANFQSLNMEGGELNIVCEKHEETLHPEGNEAVHFLIRTNPGQELLPLQKIISGGELSRISLAIHVITAQQSSIPTLIFDEVDVGIGGKTAAIVGNLLQELGQRNQVLCITHLPQVAASGEHHITVVKKQTKNNTKVSIKTLTKEERVHEIARMLGGLTISTQTLANAQELLA